MTRAEYEEKGGDYIKEHYCGNIFTPSPGERASPMGASELQSSSHVHICALHQCSQRTTPRALSGGVFE